MRLGNSLAIKMALVAFMGTLCHSRISEAMDSPLPKSNLRWVLSQNGRPDLLKSTVKHAGHLQASFNITYGGLFSGEGQPADPYDDSDSFYSGSKEDMTGRFEISTLVVDPAELKNAKERKNLGFFHRIFHAVVSFIWKSLVSVISLLVLGIYFAGFIYFLWGRRIYDEFWQGMANQYQELPEARVYQVKLPYDMMEFWEQFSFKCRRVSMIGGSIGGMLVNTMFKIRKIEGHIDPQDYINDSHMFEVEGLYKMKKRPVIDYKHLALFKNNFDFDMYYNLEYPDQIEGSKEPWVKALLNKDSSNPNKRSLAKITDQKDRTLLKNFIKATLATSNPIYYPFLINIPLKRTAQKVKFNNEEHEREWFYFEVEIVSRLGFGLNFVIGMLPEPIYTEDKTFDDLIEEGGGETRKVFDPQDTDAIPDDLASVVREGQPDWVRNFACDLKKGRKVSEDRKYLEAWKNIIPGEIPDSIGFDISSGKVKVSGGLAYAFDMDDHLKVFSDPPRVLLGNRNEPVKSMAEQEQEKAKKFQDEDEEGPQYIGDAFGIAYNCRSGYVFVTYNGTVLNKPKDNINTEINLAIMRKYDEEEEQFDYAKEMKKVNDNKYLKTLNLDANVKKEIDIRKFIKINTAPTYIPCIYCDQNTKFRINFGATAFRNRQPEFQAGILYNLTGEFEKFLDGNPKQNSQIIDVNDLKDL